MNPGKIAQYIDDGAGKIKGARNETRSVEIAAALRIEPISPLLSVLPTAGNSAELASYTTDALTHPPLPLSALEAWWTQDNRPPAQHSAVGRAAVPDPLALELLDGLGMDLTL